MPTMPDTQIDFSASEELRKWPSLNKERVNASLGARPYIISEGTLEECIQQFMQLREAQRYLYEIHTAPQSDLVGAILSTELVVELEFLLFKRRYEDAIGTAGQKSGQIGLADREREPAHVVTVTGQNIESVELDLFILAARIQRGKVGDAIDAKDYGFPIDDELLLPEPASSIHDPRIPIRPVMAVAGEQPNTVAVTLND
jgi:hypothetical protein